jgi:lipoprotein-releasing system ATP-binding protein
MFRDINERFGTTFVVITHDRRIAEKTDRIVGIRDGRISMDVSV